MPDAEGILFEKLIRDIDQLATDFRNFRDQGFTPFTQEVRGSISSLDKRLQNLEHGVKKNGAPAASVVSISSLWASLSPTQKLTVGAIFILFFSGNANLVIELVQTLIPSLQALPSP